MIHVGIIMACLAALLIAFTAGYFFGMKDRLLDELIRKHHAHSPDNDDQEPSYDETEPYMPQEEKLIHVIGQQQDEIPMDSNGEVKTEEIYRNFKTSEKDMLHERVINGILSDEGWA